MKDYTEKKIFLGIDVHKETYAVTAVCEGIVVKRANMIASPEGLVAFCKKFFPNAHIQSAYEAGFSGFHLHRVLERNEIKNLVVHAAGIEIASGDKVKTDKRDSFKIASHLATGRLKSIHIPTEEQEEKRALTRMRNTLVSHRTSVAAQIKALLHQHGLISPMAKKKVSEQWMKVLPSMSMKDGIRYALNQLVVLWQQITTQIKEINSEIVKQAEQDSELEKIYRSTPGIGAVGARVLANEIGDMSQFVNERMLFSYTGFTPSEHSSGSHIRKGHISRQGKPIIRKILVQAAWRAIAKNRALREVFERISIRAGGKRAIVAVARRLIGHIRACFRNSCLYKMETKSIVTAQV